MMIKTPRKPTATATEAAPPPFVLACCSPPEPGQGLLWFENWVGEVIQTDIGKKQGRLVNKACAALKANPCKVGYLYSVKVSSLDTAIRTGQRLLQRLGL